MAAGLKKLILLGLTLVLPRIPIFLAAYLLTKGDYFVFNKYYYSASVLIIWGTLGFEFALNNTKTKYSLLTLSVLANIFISGFILYLVIKAEVNFVDIFVISSFGFFVASANILSFRALYLGKLTAYFLINLAHSIILMLIVFIGNLLGREGLIIGFTTGSAIFFFGVFCYQNKNETKKFDGKSLVDLYSLGFSSFVINSIVPLLLTADKLIVNNTFDNITANSYTFSWTITAPLFYIGNIFEKMVYSTDRSELRLKNIFRWNGLMIILYSLIVVTYTQWFAHLLPNSIDVELVKNITLWMLTGYSIYAMLRFPINGYLFKTQKEKVQKSLARKYVIVGLLAIITYFWFSGVIAANYKLLLAFNFIVLLLLISAKIAEIWGIAQFIRLVRFNLKGSNE